jgi:hypothetical protein
MLDLVLEICCKYMNKKKINNVVEVMIVQINFSVFGHIEL